MGYWGQFVGSVFKVFSISTKEFAMKFVGMAKLFIFSVIIRLQLILMVVIISAK